MITRTQVAAEIPANVILDALDQDKDGVEDTGLLDQLIVNAILEVGSANDVAVLALVCEKIFTLAGRRPADNPFAERARAVRGGAAAGAGGLMANNASAYTAPDATHTMAALEAL